MIRNCYIDDDDEEGDMAVPNTKIDTIDLGLAQDKSGFGGPSSCRLERM